MSKIVPCIREAAFEAKVEQIAGILKERSHEVAALGLTEDQFYDGGYFRAAIEKIRGQYAATMTDKRAFMRAVLNHLEGHGIDGWSHAENSDRHDYTVSLTEGGTAVIEQKGCLDGNNVNISERPPNADEFYIWGICTNKGSDIAHGIRSAINRLTAEMIATGKRVDGIVISDMMCGDTARPCPKLAAAPNRATALNQFNLPPPCLYLFPATVAHVRLNAKPSIRTLASLKFASVLMAQFHGNAEDVNFVEYEARKVGDRTQRRMKVLRDGQEVAKSSWSVLKRVEG